MQNKKVLLGLVLLALLIALVYYLPHFAESTKPLVCLDQGGNCEHEAYADMLILYLPLVLIIGFVLGIGSAYLYFEKKVDLPKKDAAEKSLLVALPSDERKVVQKVIAEGGRVTQSELSRLEGVGKVKAHRIIDRLVKRGILEKEYNGKTNIIRIRKELKNSMES